MPIGVPKVPYRLPGEQQAQWVDLYNRLYRERVLFLGQELDDELCNQIVGMMLYLSAEDSSQNQELYINSPGGAVTCGLALFDTMEHVAANIITVCMGLAASTASFVLCGGTPLRRCALPHARVMIHQPEGGTRGQASEIIYESVEILRLRRQVGLLYAQRTGQSIDQVANDMDRDTFFSAEEARSYGLVDGVAYPDVDSQTIKATLERIVKLPDEKSLESMAGA
jgi:ATP-dependent Clp protease protease subunit|uniref:ATP-dependent Clp protease proteolytic subunit n=1 Tax=Pycnococcus provasolii TaxID=41880 RepID=C0JWY3_9CHLO|nr:ATP-dependent Clp protease proteolytic subunit [Pycnococcus provasolii]ACK36795.1 proteolytic subunit 2 of clp protease [Pycnococcus provasolii]